MEDKSFIPSLVEIGGGSGGTDTPGPKGDPGEDGVTFTPSVSEDGTLSWTNDGGLTNPDPVNIKGPAGAAGEPGADGDDGADGAPGTPGADGAPGEDGADGVTFTPSVSEDGTLSWTNDGGLTNPPPVNIKGPAGANGSDGADGTDGAPGAKGDKGDPGEGLPPGGTAGQVPVKKSGVDYDIEWADQTGGSCVPSGGTTGQVLAKASDTDGDVEWVDQASSPNLLLNSMNRQLAITQSMWTEVGGGYQATVSCPGVLADESVQNVYSTPAAAQQDVYMSCGVRCAEQKANALVYKANTLPPDLLMYVTIINVSEYTTNLVAWSPMMTSNTTPSPYVVSGKPVDDSWFLLFDNDLNSATTKNLDNNKHVIFDFSSSTVLYGLEIYYATKVQQVSIAVNGSLDGMFWNEVSIDGTGTEIEQRRVRYFFKHPSVYRYYKFSLIVPEGFTSVTIYGIKFLRPASEVND